MGRTQQHWASTHPPLRCGALSHVANRTVSLREVGRDAVHFLVPLFESCTCSSLPHLPSIRHAGSSVPPLDSPVTPEPYLVRCLWPQTISASNNFTSWS